jgi:hypothetical protein
MPYACSHVVLLMNGAAGKLECVEHVYTYLHTYNIRMYILSAAAGAQVWRASCAYLFTIHVDVGSA